MGFVYFGTREKMQWVKDPAVNMDSSKFGWSVQNNTLDGGTNVRHSWAAHKEYTLSWNLADRDKIRVIMDYADGIYGTGLIYWLNPFTMDKNVLPQYWASPFMGSLDGPILDGTYIRPTSVATPANNNDYPVNSAYYTVSGTPTTSLWIPIPPGWTAWVGVHGVSGTGGTVVVTPTTAVGTGTPTTLAMMSVTSTTRFSNSYAGNTYNGISLALGGSGTVTLSGMMIQILPDGVTPVDGGFISGQGHSGCSFAGQPTLTEYNAVFDKVGLSAKLVEQGAWL